MKMRVLKPSSDVLHLAFEKSGSISPRTEEIYLREGIALQGVAKDKRVHKMKQPEAISLYKELAVSRILGHKKEIEGLGQWRLLTAGTAETCWIRDLS